MVADHLLKALLCVVAILEDGAKFGMDTHSAVNALENVGFELDQMDEDDRQEFRAVLGRLAASADPQQREWILAVPGDLGME